jgi:DNA repair exonuclease SbcCD ATPase subunit
MSSSSQVSDVARFDVEHIGGIDSAQVDIPPGVTVLTGKNATNRTSFLQSIMGAMGSREVTLKGDADEGHIRLEFGGETYERTLTRTGDAVKFSGDPFLEEPEVADLFAFLLETNEPRQSVARGDDLREIIMRPVDTTAIKEEISRLEAEKEEINDELATIENRKTDLPRLEQRRTELREQIEDKRDELAELEEEIDENSQNIEESRREQQKLESKLDELRETRSEIESIRRKIETQEESIASLKSERSELEAEREELPSAPMGEHANLEDEIVRLREQRQSLSTEISDLQSLIQYNEERLEDDDYEVLQTLEDTSTSGELTDKLLADDEEDLICWTCGSTVDREQIEATVERLQSLRQEKVAELNDLKTELEDLKDQQSEAERKQRRRDQLDEKLDDVAAEIDRRTEQVESLKEQRQSLTETVETLESDVEDLESEDFEEILSLHTEANQLEFEIDRLESDLDEATEEIETIEGMLEDAEELRAEREELGDQLTDLRTKIDQIESQAVEEFNQHMDALLETLEYDNLDRIWIERVERSVREGRRTVDRAMFELHIVRTTENGAAYEDTIDHLSESERKVTGLIFALAGYLVHDLHEAVPFMLLDSLEAIDADRIAALVDYFSDYAEYLVVALLPEDAQALDDDYHRITDI